MENPRRILILEDSDRDVELILEEIRKIDLDFEWKRVSTAKQFGEALASFNPDVILADYTLPGFDGRTALQQVVNHRHSIPFIFVTGTLGEELAVEMLKEGATDYVLKSGLSRLGPAVVRAIRERDDLLKREEMENVHRIAMDRYRQVVENATDAVFAVDRKGHFTYSNLAGLRISGYSMGELWSVRYLDLIPADARERVRAHFLRQVLSRNPSTLYELPFRTKMGLNRWLSVNASLAMTGDSVDGFHIIARDVTERRQVEEALQESEHRFRLMVDGIRDYALYMLDPTGHVVSWNQGATRLRGYGQDEALGRPFSFFFPPEEQKRGVPAQILRQADLEGRARHEGWTLRKDGSNFYADRLVTALRDHQGGLKGFAVLTRDGTEQKQLEHAIRESETRFRTLFQASPAAIAMSSRTSGKILDVNDRYCEFFGLSRGEIIGRPAADAGFWADPAEGRKIIAEAGRRGAVGTWEVRFKKGSQELREALLSTESIDVVGEPVLVSMIVDITDRKHSEERLFQFSEQLRALAARLQSVREDEQTRIAREIHDELGQALTGLKMDLLWIEKRFRNSSESVQQSVSEKIRTMFDLIDETIRTVRRISSELRPGVLDDLGLTEALEWQLNEFAQRTGIDARFHTDADHSELDRERSTALFRIFQESLTNIARHSSATRVRTRLFQRGKDLVLEIRDNGRGVTPEELSQKSSLGILGMRERAVVFHGTVDIEGIPEKGTTVTIRIPLEPQTPFRK